MAKQKPPARGNRSLSSLRRRSEGRPVRATILIVCEGEKTEPLYFRTLRSHKRLGTARVEICGEECGSHPRDVVAYAVDLKRAASRAGNPYDQVWCVFDRDDHRKIHEAMDRAPACGIRVALSNPCFELWFLLHHDGLTAYTERDGVVSMLKRHIPDYDKRCHVYNRLLPQQEAAMARAQEGRRHHAGAGRAETENPSTSVDILVTVLNDLADN